jgi:hypothetical protein
VRRETSVATPAMPMPAPRLRIKLNRLVAFPIFSRAIRFIETVLNGTNNNPIDIP